MMGHDSIIRWMSQIPPASQKKIPWLQRAMSWKTVRAPSRWTAFWQTPAYASICIKLWTAAKSWLRVCTTVQMTWKPCTWRHHQLEFHRTQTRHWNDVELAEQETHSCTSDYETYLWNLSNILMYVYIGVWADISRKSRMHAKMMMMTACTSRQASDEGEGMGGKEITWWLHWRSELWKTGIPNRVTFRCLKLGSIGGPSC